MAVDFLVVAREELTQTRHVEATLAISLKIDERAALGPCLVEREVEPAEHRMLDRDLCIADLLPVTTLVDEGEDQGPPDVAGLSEVDRDNLTTTATVVTTEGDVGRSVQAAEVSVERLNNTSLGTVGQLVHHGQVDIGAARPGQNNLDDTARRLGQVDGLGHGLLFEIDGHTWSPRGLVNLRTQLL